MANRRAPSKLPMKQETGKKKWDNTTKVIPKVDDNSTPKVTTTRKATRSQIPHIIRALTPDSEIDSFFQRRKPEASAFIATTSGPSSNLKSSYQIQAEKSDSIPFGYVEPTNSILSKQPKRDRDYPKPWLSKPTRLNFAEQNAFNMKISQKLQDSQHQPKRQLAQNQSNAPRPQFGPETKELALLYANSRRESRAIDKESRLMNYNEFEPPWRRPNVDNESANRISIKPPHMVGTKLKIEMKPPRKEKVTVKVPKFLPKQTNTSSNHQYPIGESDRPYPKPWRAEYELLKSDDERASLDPPIPKKSEQDRNGNKDKTITVLNRIGEVNYQSKLKASKYSVRPPSSPAGFTFEEAVRGVLGYPFAGRSREEFSSYELEVEPKTEEELEEEDEKPKTPVLNDHHRKQTRMPLRTKFFPKQPTPEIEKTPEQLGPLSEDDSIDFETGMDEIATTDYESGEVELRPGKSLTIVRSSRQFISLPKTPPVILPQIIRSGEFHAKPKKSTSINETSSSLSSDEDGGTDERATTSLGQTDPYGITTTDDVESIKPPKPKTYTKTNPRQQRSTVSSSSPSRISDNIASTVVAAPKKFVTRLPIPRKKVNVSKGPSRKTIGSRKIVPRKQPKAQSTKTISDWNKNVKADEKLQSDKLLNTLSYTIVRNVNGDGMMKLFEDGTTVPILESDEPGLHSIMFCRADTDVKMWPQIMLPLNGVHPAHNELTAEHVELVDSKKMGEVLNKPSYTVTAIKIESYYSNVISDSDDDKVTSDYNDDMKDVPDSISYTLISDKTMSPESKTPPASPKASIKPDPLKQYMQPVQPKGTEKQCYTAEVVWDTTPFTTQNLIGSDIPEQQTHIGAELLTIFPPPTAYRDEKRERLVGLADESHNIYHDSNIKTGNHQFYEHSNQPSGFPAPIGLNIINLNYMSSSSSQSLQKSKRESREPRVQVPIDYNATQDHKREIYGMYEYRQRENPALQDSRLYQQHQGQSCCNNENMSSCPFSHNQHYEPYQCFHQIFEDDFSQPQYPASNSRLPKGNFLPPIVTRGRHECQECTNKYCYACSCSKNQKAGMNSKYFGEPYQQEEEYPQFYWPNREYPHSCEYHQCEHQHKYDQQQEYWHQQQTKARTPQEYQQSIPFTSVKSSVAFTVSTVTEPSADLLYSSKPSVENKCSFLPKIKCSETENCLKKVSFEDCNNNVYHKTQESTKSLQSHGEQVFSGDSGSDNESSTAGDESTDGNEVPDYVLPKPRRLKSLESKIVFDKTLEHDSVKLKKYLLQLFLQKPSTAKRTHQYVPHASPPPPTAVTADSSNASIRVLMSRDENHLMALPNCDCLSCRKCHKYLGTHRSRSLTCLDQIDYVRKNIKDTKKFKKKIPDNPDRVVDHPKGDRVAPIILYAGRKGYGIVPEYIKKRKTELLAAKQAQIDAELDRTIERLNAIEDRRKKSRRYWIKQVADQTRDKLGPEFVEQENIKGAQNRRRSRLRRTPLPRSKCDDIIFIGSYHSDVGGNKNNKGQAEDKPNKLSTPSKCLKQKEENLTPTEFETLTDKRLRLRTGSAPRNLKPFSAQSSASNSSLLLDVRIAHSVPDNVDYM